MNVIKPCSPIIWRRMPWGQHRTEREPILGWCSYAARPWAVDPRSAWTWTASLASFFLATWPRRAARWRSNVLNLLAAEDGTSTKLKTIINICAIAREIIGINKNILTVPKVTFCWKSIQTFKTIISRLIICNLFFRTRGCRSGTSEWAEWRRPKCATGKPGRHIFIIFLLS